MDFKNRVGQFDELIRCYRVLVDDVNFEKTLLNVLTQQRESILQYQEMREECTRLKLKLDLANKDMSVVVEKLASARRWLDTERQKRKRVEQEREVFIRHLEDIRRIILNDPRQKVSDEAKAKLAFLDRVSSESSLNDGDGRLYPLHTIAEPDSFSDMSFSRSADDLDIDYPMTQPTKRNRSVFLGDELAAKKRKSSVDMHFISPPPPLPPYSEAMKTPVLAETKELIDSNAMTESAVHRINMRCHNFVNKNFIMPESCSFCSKKIGFGRSVYKCLDCQTIAHPECSEKVTLPCVPSGVSPKKAGAGFISDYTPSVPPMVPAVVVHTAVEVERRGLKEIGIYRMSGTEAVVRGLREKLMKGRGVPCLTDVDIHSVCCFLKDFLRNLQDPLIPQHKRGAFAAAITDRDNKQKELEKIIRMLPQANRDTLAYLILHLQKVAQSAECKMSSSNLATVFGPTVVGYSSTDRMTALTDAHTSNAIMEELLLMPSTYWNEVLSGVEPRTPLFGDTFSKTPRRLMTATTPGTKRKFFRASPPP